MVRCKAIARSCRCHSISYFSDEKLKKLAADTVRDTLMLFEAEQPPAGEIVILAAGASGILLHEAIGHRLEADFNFKRLPLLDMMNQKSLKTLLQLSTAEFIQTNGVP